ncbi:MFS transporter [Lysinibacillus contaminans]|uniref:MFS transporter n=1 Tax=Lysinibacillus contaminans TaxID=1293441 RepID=A0ABR5JZ87_9BACI|nr:MFS transporter [Lysinibacillus contaminans]KOS67972.1 MFS transporter [Lysinibacillus contaminans]
MNQQKKKIHYAWWLLIGLSIMVGVGKNGISTAGGLFLTPVTQDLGIGMGSLTLYFSIASIVTMIFLPIAGKLMAKYDIKLILIVAIILMAGSFAMFGLMSSVWGWYLFSIPMAIGSVFITQIAGPVLINNWFKKHNGLAIGIMVAIGGVLGAVIQPTVGNLIATQGWRFTYIALGIAVAAIIIPIILLVIRMSPQQKGLQPLGMDEVETNEGSSAQQVTAVGVTAAVAKKSSAFFALLAFFFIITSIASFSQHIAPFAMGIGYDIKFAGSVLGAMQIGVLVGALSFGVLSDKIGAKSTAVFAMLLGLIPVGILLTVPENPTLFTVAIIIFGFVVSSLGTLGPLLTTALFGSKDYSQIYSTAAIGLAVAGIVALPGYGFVYEITGSYTFVLYGLAIMLVLNALLVLLAFKGKKKLEKAGLWK